MQKQELYREKLEARMAQYDAKIEELKARALELQADSKLELLEQMEQVDVKRQDLKRWIEKLKKDGENAVQDVELGVEKAWHDLEDAFDKALNHFKR